MEIHIQNTAMKQGALSPAYSVLP